MKVIVLIFALFFMADSPWKTDFVFAQKAAKENSKLVLLYFSGSDWCGPCIKLKKDVLEKESFLTFAQNCLFLVRADFPRAKKNQLATELKMANEALAEKYNAKGKFPLTVLINGDGKVLKQWEGFPSGLNAEKLEAEISIFTNAIK
jgi:thioredoxin-related protein